MSQLGYPDHFGALLERRNELRPALPKVEHKIEAAPAEPGKPLPPDFADQVRQFVHGIDRIQKDAHHQGEEFAVGHSNDIHGTMITVEQAEISLRILANVRNRVVDLYREVMRMGS